MDILLKNGKVIDPANGMECVTDVYIAGGVIKEIGNDLKIEAERVIDARGLWVTPGLIDLHVHLREPGYEHKEDIKSGTRAAAIGGFTTICAMPNTKPATDSVQVVEKVRKIVESDSIIDVKIIGAATKGQSGEELTNIKAMAESGICAVSEDGFSVLNSALAAEAFKECAKNNLPMFSHCEDLSLVNGGVINQGNASAKLGLPGISNASEEVIAARDIILAGEAGVKLHLCHMSTKGSADIIRAFKSLGAKISAECCPHHFTLCDDDIIEDDGNYKMNPPLRSKKDKNAIIEAIRDNTIDIIATDHAPHHESEKDGGFKSSANGIVGLETALALTITELVKKGIITPSEMVKKMSLNPAKVLGIEAGRLSIGSPADITIINPDFEFEVDASAFESKGKNTPFNGRKLYGRAEFVIKNGKTIVEHGRLMS